MDIDATQALDYGDSEEDCESENPERKQVGICTVKFSKISEVSREQPEKFPAGTPKTNPGALRVLQK